MDVFIKNIFIIIGDIIEFIFDIKLFDVPLLLLYVLVIFGIGYFASEVLIGFPWTLVEEITKKKINHELQNKIIELATICFGIIIIFILFAEERF